MPDLESNYVWLLATLALIVTIAALGNAGMIG